MFCFKKMKALHRVNLSMPIVALPLEPILRYMEMILCLSEDGMFVKMEVKEGKKEEASLE